MLPHQSAVRFTTGLLIAGLLATPALAATGTVDSGSATLRVRSEASVAGDVLAKLSNGTQVEVLSKTSDGWYEISCDQAAGYVSGEYLKVDAAEADALPVQSGPIYLRVDTGSSPLNIRSGPGTSYEKAGKLQDGDVVRAIEEADGWYKIEDGYICADYVQQIDAEEAAAAEQEKKASGAGAEIAAYAQQYLGYSYVYGGSSPKGFDCSGFTKYIYKQFGYSINRSASDQLKNGSSVSKDELQPGDLVFFRQGGSSRPASHVGLYIGNGEFIHASEPGVGVIISGMDSHSARGYVGARRIV